MEKRWTFTVDADPRLVELRRQLLARSMRSPQFEPLGYANFEARTVSPPISSQEPSWLAVHPMLREFLSDLGPAFPLRPSLPAWWEPTLVEMNEVEQDLWGTLVAGIDFSPGVYEGEPSLAADWVAALLISADDAGGSRYFRASHLFDIHGNSSVTWFLVAPTRVVMVCLVGAD